MYSDTAQPLHYSNEHLQVAQAGNLVIKDTNAHTGMFGGFVAWADAVISAMSINDAAVTLSDLGLASTTIPAGAQFFVAETDTITSITLASGTLNLIKR